MIHRLEAKVSCETLLGISLSPIFFNVSDKFNKPDKGKVFHIESRSLGVTDLDLSQHNTVQIMNL